MEKDKDVINVITNGYSKKERIYIALSAAAVITIAALAFFAGFFLPKPIGAINISLNAYEKKDGAYLDALDAYTASEKEIEKLNTDLGSTAQELEEFNQSRDSIDKITQKNNELETQKEQLQNEINSKRAVLDTLDGKTSASSSSALTLTSGRYTAGENLTAGNYTITGTGSIVISNSGTARVNKSLKSDGEKFTLSEGDILRIDGSAKLIKEE